MRNFHSPGRSPVYARHAMCATSHPLASAAALDVLKSGGNAVDAAIAATAVLCVVEHPMTGIGGDCFALIAKPGQRPIALNASGRAPAALTSEFLLAQGINAIQTQTAHAVTVPGAIDGWVRLVNDHGTRALGTLLAPAIAYAEDGFPVAPRVSDDWARAREKLEANAAARSNFLIDGKPPIAGQTMRFPALAETLKAIAAGGRDAFYDGEIANDMVNALRDLGGVHTLEDFQNQHSCYVEPISIDYRGHEIIELPPNNHGIVVLIMLRLMERYGTPPSDPESADRHHLMLEFARMAYAMRDEFVADPEMADVPVSHMLSDETIENLLARFDPKQRNADLGPLPQPQGSDTVYLSIVDADGMAVSFINSLFANFGSGIVSERSGVLFHNRAEGFCVDPAHRNNVAPRKRPLHTLIPALALKEGELSMSFGVMGGAYQPAGHAHVLANMLDYRMDPQSALDAPRVFFEDGVVKVEQTVSETVRAGLAQRGHTIEDRLEPWGGGQIVQKDQETGTLIGASDPRKDGCAIGY